MRCIWIGTRYLRGRLGMPGRRLELQHTAACLSCLVQALSTCIQAEWLNSGGLLAGFCAQLAPRSEMNEAVEHAWSTSLVWYHEASTLSGHCYGVLAGRVARLYAHTVRSPIPPLSCTVYHVSRSIAHISRTISVRISVVSPVRLKSRIARHAAHAVGTP